MNLLPSNTITGKEVWELARRSEGELAGPCAAPEAELVIQRDLLGPLVLTTVLF